MHNLALRRHKALWNSPAPSPTGRSRRDHRADRTTPWIARVKRWSAGTSA